MPKVREVLERIGDAPLIEALQDRGFFVVGVEGFEDKELDKMTSLLRDEGYLVAEPGEGAYIEDGFHLYRMRKTDEFRLWLRDFFWQQLGRIV